MNRLRISILIPLIFLLAQTDEFLELESFYFGSAILRQISLLKEGSIEIGRDVALGISFTVPNDFNQVFNALMTLAQRRYLVNASATEKVGFLNILLSKNEWKFV
jgi:hypothetical protein